jgi:hypothetical protein
MEPEGGDSMRNPGLRVLVALVAAVPLSTISIVAIAYATGWIMYRASGDQGITPAREACSCR